MHELNLPGYSWTLLSAAAFKLAAVIVWASALKPKAGNTPASIVAAWMLTFVAQVAVLLIASAFHQVDRVVVWVFLVAWLLGGIVACRGVISLPRVHAVWAPIAVLVIFLAWRTLAFSDLTWDAQTYGIPRIALWMNFRSVFVHMPTLQQNLFTSEWNGELDALTYGLISGRVDQLAFFNVEAICVLAVSTYWLAQLLGARRSVSAAIAALVCAMPATMGLAITVKGDLLACAAVVTSFAWIESARRSGSSFALAFALLSLALAAGAKISTIPGAMIVFVLVIWSMRDRLLAFAWSRTAALTSIGCAVLVSRYLTNVITHGSPFARVEGEEAHLSPLTLMANMEVVGTRWFNFWPTVDGQVTSYALSGGLGLLGAFVLAGIITRGARRERVASLVFVSLLGALVAMSLILPSPWALRYFLPFLIPPFVWALAGLGHGPRAVRFALTAAVLVGGCANFAAAFVAGELNPHGDMWDYAATISSKPPLTRVLVGYEPYAVVAGVDRLRLEAGSTNIAMFNQVNCLMTQFIGSRAQNKLWLARSLPGLATIVRERHPDVVVIGRPFRYSMDQKSEYFPPEILDAVAPGYRWIENNETYVIAVSPQFALSP
jgi:hypothetical protein